MRFLVFFLMTFFLYGCVALAGTDQSIDSAMALLQDNASIIGIIGAWVVNLVWKLWPTKNPTGILIKIRDLLKTIREKRVIEKIIEIMEIFVGILDLILAPVPNRLKK